MLYYRRILKKQLSECVVKENEALTWRDVNPNFLSVVFGALPNELRAILKKSPVLPQYAECYVTIYNNS